MASVETDIETPCTRVCAVHPTRGLCVGCGRSLEEVARWIDLGPAQRAAIMAQLPSRLAALSGASASGRVASPMP